MRGTATSSSITYVGEKYLGVGARNIHLCYAEMIM